MSELLSEVKDYAALHSLASHMMDNESLYSASAADGSVEEDYRRLFSQAKKMELQALAADEVDQDSSPDFDADKDGDDKDGDAANDDQSEDEEVDEECLKAKWTRFRRHTLSHTECQKLATAVRNAVRTVEGLDDYNLGWYMQFADRLVREYKYLHKKLHDPMHLEREKIVSSAVQTISLQVRPTSDQLTPEDIKDLCPKLQPIVEQTLGLRGVHVHVKNTQGWVEQKIADQTYDFPDAIKHEPIMQDLTERIMREGDETGWPKVHSTQLYTC